MPSEIITSKITINSNICSICIDEINIYNYNNLFITPCKHCFHLDCINDWFLYNTSCPNCRQQIIFRNDNIDNIVQYNFNDINEISEDIIYGLMYKDIITIINNSSRYIPISKINIFKIISYLISLFIIYYLLFNKMFNV